MVPDKEKIEFRYFFLGFFNNFIQDVNTNRVEITALLDDNDEEKALILFCYLDSLYFLGNFSELFSILKEIKETSYMKDLIDIGYKTIVLDSCPEFYFNELSKEKKDRDYIEEICKLWEKFKSYNNEIDDLQNISHNKFFDYILISTYNYFYTWAYELKDNQYFGFSKFKEIIFYKTRLIEDFDTKYSNSKSSDPIVGYWNSLICNSLGTIFSNILSDEGDLLLNAAQKYYIKSLELQNNIFALSGLGTNFYDLSNNFPEHQESLSKKGIEYYTLFENNFKECIRDMPKNLTINEKDLPKNLTINEIEYYDFFSTKALLHENCGEDNEAEGNYKIAINIIESKIDKKCTYDSYPYYNLGVITDDTDSIQYNIDFIQKGVNILEKSTGINISKEYVPYLYSKSYIPAIEDFEDYCYSVGNLKIKKLEKKDLEKKSLEEITKNLKKLNIKPLEQEISDVINLNILLLESEFYIKCEKWNVAKEKLAEALDLSDSESDKIYIYELLIKTALKYGDIDEGKKYINEALGLSGDENIKNIVKALSSEILSTKYIEKPIEILKINKVYYSIIVLLIVIIICAICFFHSQIPEQVFTIITITICILISFFILIPFINMLQIKRLKVGGIEIEFPDRKNRKKKDREKNF